ARPATLRRAPPLRSSNGVRVWSKAWMILPYWKRPPARRSATRQKTRADDCLKNHGPCSPGLPPLERRPPRSGNEPHALQADFRGLPRWYDGLPPMQGTPQQHDFANNRTITPLNPNQNKNFRTLHFSSTLPSLSTVLAGSSGERARFSPAL